MKKTQKSFGKLLPPRTVSFSLQVSVTTIAEYEERLGLPLSSQAERNALQKLLDALVADEKALSAWIDVLAFYEVGHFYAKDLHEDDYASHDKALFEILKTVVPSLEPKFRSIWEKRLSSPAWMQSDAGCALMLSFVFEITHSTPARPPWASYDDEEEFEDEPLSDETPAPTQKSAKNAPKDKAPKAKDNAATRPAKAKTTKAKS